MSKKNRWIHFPKLNQNKVLKYEHFMNKNYASHSKPYQPAQKRSYFPYFTKFPPFNQPFFTSPPKKFNKPNVRKKFESQGFKRTFGLFVKKIFGRVQVMRTDILKSFMKLTHSACPRKYLLKPKNSIDPWLPLKKIEKTRTTTVTPYQSVNTQTEKRWQDKWHTQRVTFRPLKAMTIEQSFGLVEEVKHSQEDQKKGHEVTSLKQTEVTSAVHSGVDNGDIIDSVYVDSVGVDRHCANNVTGAGNGSYSFGTDSIGSNIVSSEGIFGDNDVEGSIGVGSYGVKTDPPPSTIINSMVRFVTSKPWNRLYKEVASRESTSSAVRKGGGGGDSVKGATWRPRARGGHRGDSDMGEDIWGESEEDPGWGTTESTAESVKRYQTSRPWRELYRDRETVLGIQLLKELVYPR